MTNGRKYANRSHQAHTYLELKEKSLDGYARTDKNGHFLEVNKAFERMLGYTEEELNLLTYNDITPQKWHDKEAILMKKMLQDGHSPLYEKEYIRKDGICVPVEIRSYLIRDAHGQPNGKWAFIRDITTRKKIQTRMKASARELNESNQALQEFVYFASHDLKEPLRKIKTFGNMLVRQDMEGLDDKARDYILRMISATRRMDSLLDELLRYSRISNSQAAPDGMVDLGQVVRQALSNIESLSDRNESVQIGPLPVCRADATRMLQLFQNLLSNAAKFRASGIPLKIKVGYKKVETREEAAGVTAWYEVFVRDNGIGIDGKYMDDIFTPFHRLHGRSEYEGAGMGLAICKKIVTQHGGTIRVEQNSDHGVTFKVRLPAGEDDSRK